MDKCEANKILETNKVRKTEQRITLLSWIVNNTNPFTAGEIYHAAGKKTNIDLATVYRILNMFVKKQIIRQVVNSEGFQYYELSCIHHPEHPHFICTRCHKIDCLDKMERMDLKVMDVFKEYCRDSEINSVTIHFSGTCRQCLKRQPYNREYK